MKKQPEYELQKSVCAWLNKDHPDILFMTDSIAAVKLTLPQQGRNKAVQKKGFKCPDLIIFKPNEKYHGLFIELKTKSPFKKNCLELRKCDHLEAQQSTINQLNKLNYFACFSWDLNPTKQIINDYLNDKL